VIKNIDKIYWKKRRQFNYETEIGGAFQFCRGQGGEKKLTSALHPHQIFVMNKKNHPS
jgi:hypothetical protein